MAGLASILAGIEKLNHYNYDSWRTCMESYLQGEDFLEASKALYAIKIIVEKEFLEHIKKAQTPSEAWNILSRLFSKTNEARLQMLENELASISQGSMTISQYFTKVKSLCDEISLLDKESAISETRVRRIIIRGLRPEYNGFMTLLEAENMLTKQETINKKMTSVSIKETEEALLTRKKGPSRRPKQQRTAKFYQQKESYQQRGASQQYKNNRRNVICYNYSKKGHYARECWYNKRMSVEGNTTISSSQQGDKGSEEEWEAEASYCIIEPGEHGCSVEDYSTVSAPNPGIVYYSRDWIVDSGCSNPMTGDKQKFQSMSEYKGKLPITHIGQALCIPRFNKEEAQLQNVYHVIHTPEAPRTLESIYIMSAESAYVEKTRRNETTDLWHARLGHVGNNKLKVMMAKSMLKGLPQLEVRTDTVSMQPLELIHSDVFEQVKQESNTGMQYMITFVDDFSRYVWVYFLKEKSEAFSMFIEFKEKVEKELTCPNTLQQNEVAERKNRHLTEVCRSMLHKGMKTAAHVINRLSQASLGFLSPYEKLWNHRPTVSYFRVFGCVCYVFGWRCCDLNTNRCYTSRNVIFDEATSWWSSEKIILPNSEIIEENLQEKINEQEDLEPEPSSPDAQKSPGPWSTGVHEQKTTENIRPS
uniref:Integrase catalytic domain-containing protein n=1 Tax=Nelumbo nucifera TaxID=4432 RepID=A0A822XIK8_NELNU|nr:TPA_asm: hypothetical protein HUJ06_020342 [Nelumbo nucifera]